MAPPSAHAYPRLDHPAVKGQRLAAMDLEGLQHLLNAMAGVRVAAVGDVMVDRFVHGEVGRISAEAPIPILTRAREAVMLGAAGNVARNIAALGGAAALVGVVGDDGAGHEAAALVASQAGIEGFLVTDSARPTTVKTRFVAAGQQLLRVDLEEIGLLAGKAEQTLLTAIGEAARGAGAILISDYGKGAVTAAVIEACLAAARAAGAALIVDSKARSFAHYGAVDLIKPNAAELARATDLATGADAEVEAALTRALELCEARAILVTRSAKGMSLAVRGRARVRHFIRPAAEVFDTSGAGDTALAAVGLALAAGAEIDQAVEFALLASSVAVEKAGTATVSPAELVEAEISTHRAPSEAKIATAARMAAEVARWRSQGLKIGFTNGCFDILHPGHVAYLGQARAWCDRLIVGLNSDASVRALKGEGRPVNDLEARALVLAALACVDLVVPFDEETPMALIEAAAPDVLVKGGDYTAAGVVGHEFVTARGGQVRIAPLVAGYSTTGAIRKLSGNG
jgi:D-beta-D-heptose 7-phosphate kinase/D-beta-D-heptose 1-phosphate adenosyltransferase